MIIHMWMHWFWITTSSFKYFLFLIVQMISLSCIFHPIMSEAGLLNNNISTHFDLHAPNNSSQIVLGVNITAAHEEEVNVTSVNTSYESSTASPIPLINMDNLTSQEDAPVSEKPIFFEESIDFEDTYNGGSLEVFQYPLKKVTKFSQIKFGKLTVKPKTKEEIAEEEKKMEAVNVVEENMKLNVSVQDRTDESKMSSVDVDGGQGNSSKPTESIITTVVSIDNFTLNESNGTEPEGEESLQVTTTVSSSSQFSTNTSEIAEVTENPKDADLLKNETLVIENKIEESVIRTTAEPFIIQNRAAAATSAQNSESNQAGLNAGSITGIILGILVVFSLFGAVSFVLYRRRFLNKPQVLQDKSSNLDSSGYIDDTSLREHSEEMYSLDNDSFLNSLEAMTIQNYWTESVKHTKL